MKRKTLMITVMVLLLATGSALAQMGVMGHMGIGNGLGSGSGHMGSVYGYGSGYGSGMG